MGKMHGTGTMAWEDGCAYEGEFRNDRKHGVGTFRWPHGKSWQNLRKFCQKSANMSAIFNEKIEIRERCKGVHCVDLGESS